MNSHSGINETGSFNSLITAARCGALIAATLSALFASSPASAYTVGYTFGGPPDGASSFSNLTRVGTTTYYGVTYRGGTYGYGTIFKLVGSAETVLYSFQGNQSNPSDGAYPRGGLVLAPSPWGKALFGTTSQGGSGPASNCPFFGSCGTIFAWQLTNCTGVACYHHLVDFTGGSSDGYAPVSSLTLDNRNVQLYGTTLAGGPSCPSTYSSCGTLYSINPLSPYAETPLHLFSGSTTSAGDGANPFGAPIVISGKLYGSTTEGGDATCTTLPDGCGTVYKITTAGAETVLYRFHSVSDGADPFGELVVDSSGFLWGTTFWGGANNQGTVFKILRTAPYTYSSVYAFSATGFSDGAHPDTGLTLDAAGTLWGVTTSGGANTNCQSNFNGTTCGTLFSVTALLANSGVYSFDGSTGGNPYGALLSFNGSLFGTASYGGTIGNGTPYGVVFRYP